jgi:hypothetical protein
MVALTSRHYYMLVAACIAHALLVLSLWSAAALFGRAVLSAPVWLVLAVLWLTWPMLLVRYAQGRIVGVTVTVLIGAAILAPCIPTIFTFAAWAISGFAP